jgi:GH15 family glucan-1,4-alpha-glucosidase
MSGDLSAAAALLAGMHDFASGVGLIPEQDWETADIPASPYGTDPTVASIGFQNGKAAGSASPLTWSAASFVRLTASSPPNGTSCAPGDLPALRRPCTRGTTTLTV